MKFTKIEATKIYFKLKEKYPHNNWKKIPLPEFQIGINVELEHGRKFARYGTNVTNDDPIITGKIALIHIIEVEHYYTLLKKYVDPN